MNGPSEPIAFVNVTLIPMDQERLLPGQTVIAQNGCIQEIGPVQGLDIPPGTRQIDAAGRYLMPALADLHIHLEGLAWNIMFPPEGQFSADDLDFERILFPYIANGITTIQVMSALPEHIALRERINHGELLGPRLVLNRMVDRAGPAWPPPISTWVENPMQARQAVLDAKTAEYDGVKAYSFLTPTCYDALLDTAAQVGLPVRGHIPEDISLEHALGRGQDLIAHAEEVMKAAKGDYSPERIDHDAGMIARSNTWITPTLTTTRRILAIFDDLDSELSRPEMKVLHPMALGIWNYLLENIYLKMTQEHRQAIRDGFESFQRPFTRALHQQGARLLAGTDALIPTTLPGFSVHDELEELVAVGLSPYQALQTATVHPMAYLGELDQAGTLETGKRSDLVLLGANPLADIRSTRSIQGVLCGGTWLDHPEIQRRLGQV